jgi:hypothetical protein
MNTQPKDDSIREDVRLRRNIFFAPDIAVRLDALVKRGAIASNVIGVALQRSLTTIEKQFGQGKEIPGLKIRKER